MQRFYHRRGNSQEISRLQRNRDKDFIDLKQNYGFSSQHTRSTALTFYRNKSKQKDRDRADKEKDKAPQKDMAGTSNKEKKKNKFNKNLNLVWKQDEAPFTPYQILKLYSPLLQPIERCEIREYQNIYYIGLNKSEENTKQSYCPEQLFHKIRGFFSYRIGGHISYRYEIICPINKGSFGQVLKVYDHKTNQFVALKIVKKNAELIKQSFIEISILSAIKQKDKNNVSGIIRIKDFTIFREHICIIFELMDQNLFELLHANQFKGLNEQYAKRFAIQMLNSLNFLEKMQIVHCDIKPQNFVLKVWGKSGIKLIDFGASCYQNQQVYTYIQSRYYRAPQILFQRSYTTSIDMWSYGCLMAELILGKPLFPGNSNLCQLMYMINLLGFPQLDYANACREEIEIIREGKYLQKDQSNGKVYEHNIKRFEKERGCKIDEESLIPLEQRFDKDMYPFLHFLKQILKWDPRDRITPSEALQHPWIKSGLPNQIREIYTIYQGIDKSNLSSQSTSKKSKRNKSKSKSKSRQKSQQKSASVTKTITNMTAKNSVNLKINFKKESKALKFDLPQALMSVSSKNCKKKKSEQKSRPQKANKSPVSKGKLFI